MGTRIINIIKKPAVIVILIIIAASSYWAYAYFKGKNASPYDYIIAERRDIVQEVSVTGRVKPAKEVSLAFEKMGRIGRVNVKVGDNVFAGQALAQLDANELIAQKNEAETNVAYQKAKLEELKKGIRPEEIKVAETKVDNAKVSLQDARINLADKLQDAYTKSDDAIRGKTDQLFSNPRTANPQINFIGFYKENEVEWARFNLEQSLAKWQALANAINVSGNPEFYTEDFKKNLEAVRNYLDLLAFGVNALMVDSTLSKTTLDAYKSDISTARTNINTAIVNLSSADEKFKTAQSSLMLAENELLLKKAGATFEQIAAQEAQMNQAEAKIQVIQAQIEKGVIASPINGVVTKQDAKVGEIVSANSALVSVVSDAKYEIEANVPEADIAKVKIGDKAKVTLDAYSDDVLFEAIIVAIDPAETIIEGVATYKITMQFAKEDNRVKPGMTANVDIVTAERQAVFAIPQRAVIDKNNVKVARVLDGENVKEVSVKTGIRDTEGNIEILEGINQGDKVIVFVKEE